MEKRKAVMTVLLVLTIGSIAADLGVGCLLAAEEPEQQAARVPAVVPQAAREVKNPIEADQRSLDYGELLFSSQCVMCHGKSGAGDGDLVGRLKLVMPDFTDPATLKDRTDGELYYILTNGHGRMPGQEDRFDDKTRWDLVNYMRTLKIDVR